MNVFRLFAVVVVFIGAQLQFGLVWDLGCPHGYHGDHQPAGYRDSGKYSALIMLMITRRRKKAGKNPCFQGWESIGLEGEAEFWKLRCSRVGIFGIYNLEEK